MAKAAINRIYRNVIKWIEILLALSIFIGSLVYGFESIIHFTTLDWTMNDAYFDLIHRVLFVVIGIELVKMLLTHSLESILELMAFVIARKILLPELDSIDLILSVAAFVALIAARHYILHCDTEDPTHFEQSELK
ncbi:hypothetical protein GF340_06155 [Candidatus Peregrinibacteria bacterium]|nr:hypothetical protein [Candidatus Peregrinibacteria bacterium]